MKQYKDIVPLFTPISLDEMDNVKLMNRIDTKYLLNIKQLPNILKIAQKDYRIVEIKGARIMGYESLYFDTPDHEMYIKHHNRKLNRYKVRIRQYLDSHEFFLEIKFKNNKGRTKKKRITVDGIHALNQAESKDLLTRYSPYSFDQIAPVLFTAFERITLVNQQLRERITIDLNLDLHNESKKVQIPYLAIVEVKRESSSSIEGFGRILRDERVFPKRISKYCTGTNLIYPELKHNRFKPKIQYLKKLDKTKQYDQLYSAII